MKLVIHGYDAAETEQTAREFQSLGVDAFAVSNDFTNDDAVDQLQQVVDHFGTLHLLVNNAADLRRTHFFDADAALLDYELALNLRAPYLCALRAAAIMRPAQAGSIVNISSVGGLRAHWRGLPYDVTKGGIDAMTRAMALDLAREGIRVNAVAPGAIEVGRYRPRDEAFIEALVQRIPMARLGTPLEVGAMVAFLASSDASYVTGQVFYMDGGVTSQFSPPGQPI